MYLTREEDKLNPLASPLLAPDSMIRTSPETLIIVCDNDFFCDEGLSYGKRLAENGVTVTMKNFMGQQPRVRGAAERGIRGGGTADPAGLKKCIQRDENGRKRGK